MKNKHLTFKGAMVILALVFLAMFITDYSIVREGYDPIFAKVKGTNNQSKFHFGPFYYFDEEISDCPSQPLSHSPHVGVGVWFIPTVPIYSAR